MMPQAMRAPVKSWMTMARLRTSDAERPVATTRPVSKSELMEPLYLGLKGTHVSGNRMFQGTSLLERIGQTKTPDFWFARMVIKSLNSRNSGSEGPPDIDKPKGESLR